MIIWTQSNDIQKKKNTFEIQQNASNAKITEEQINNIETMIDQIEDIKKRNELVTQNIDDFMNQFDKIKTSIDLLKNKCLEEHKFCKTKLKEFGNNILEFYIYLQELQYYQDLI